MRESGNPFWCALQWPTRKTTASLQNQERLLRRYFQTRHLIPDGNLLETTFEDLVADRTQTIFRMCKQFAIKPPVNFAPIEDKARNARPSSLPPDSWLPLIREHYKPLFDAGIYPQP
jgi:hypothetical protein